MVVMLEKERILSYLKHQSEPCTAAQIAQAVGMGDDAKSITFERTRRHIRDLRLEGIPIASSSSGFWITHDRHELRATIEHLASRERAIRDVKEALIMSMWNDDWF